MPKTFSIGTLNLGVLQISTFLYGGPYAKNGYLHRIIYMCIPYIVKSPTIPSIVHLTPPTHVVHLMLYNRSHGHNLLIILPVRSPALHRFPFNRHTGNA
jgi:hypothetical protein